MMKHLVSLRQTLRPRLGLVAVYTALVRAWPSRSSAVVHGVDVAQDQVYVLGTAPTAAGGPHARQLRRSWTSNHFSRYFLNSSIVALVTMTLVLLLGSMMAHGLARYRFQATAS
jgi:ABC-type glycerol-3-phosphate transport system permease component